MKGTPQVLPPSFENFPIGYTGRTSTLVLSGTGIPRPKGMIREDGRIVVRPTRSMDYEMEVAAVIGKATDFGDSIKSADIADYIFGLVLMNDWSGKWTLYIPQLRG
jgi:fumarylacetoacetase